MANNKNITFDQLHFSMTKIKGELDKKANNNHGIHVEYYDDDPKVAGTLTAGSSSKLSRGDHVHPAQTTITGNAGTATKLANARTLTIGNTGKTFDGSANVSWNLNEIGAAPNTHSHNFLNIKGSNTISSATNDTTVNWAQQNNSVHWYSTAGQIIDQPSQYGFLINLANGGDVHQIWTIQSSGNMYHRGGNGSGWSGTWRTILDSSNFTSYSPTLSGGGAIGTWGISISGNASTTTKLQTARNIGKASFNGTANIDLSDIMGRAATSSSSSTNKNKYTKFARVDISSGTYTNCCGKLSIVSSESNHAQGILDYYFRTNDTISSVTIGLYWTSLSTSDYANTIYAVKASDGIYDLYYKPIADWDTIKITNIDCTNPDKITFYSSQSFVSSITAVATSSLYSYSSACLGNANTATTLKTARTINGTSFNGSANITTANWGTGRTLTIGNSGKSVNGSGNVSWSLSEIGAQPANSLTIKTVSHRILTLGTELYQYAEITSNNTIINLPSVSSFTEIHLFFDWPSGVSITMPSNVKWQEGIMYGPGYTHEFIFTYINSAIGWLGGCVVYG